MLNTTDDQSQQPGQNSSSPQQSRTDFQQTNPSSGQTTAPVSQSPTISQQELTTDQLRVGETTVQNNTSTPSNYIISHNYLNASWLWLLVPIVLAILLFRPEKKKPVTNASQNSTPVEGFTPTTNKTTESAQSDQETDVLKAAVAIAVPESVKKATKKAKKKSKK